MCAFYCLPCGADDCSKWSEKGTSTSDCEQCISNSDTTGDLDIDTTCQFCTTSGICSGVYPKKPTCDRKTKDPNGWVAHYVDQGQSCTGPPERNAAEVLVDATVCVGEGIGGAFKSVVAVIKALASLTDSGGDSSEGIISKVCKKFVGVLEGKGAGELNVCDTEQLCLVLGPEAMVCDIVMVGVCIVNDGDGFNPCQWLLAQAGADPDTVCNDIEKNLGMLPGTN